MLTRVLAVKVKVRRENSVLVTSHPKSARALLPESVNGSGGSRLQLV